MNYAIQTKLLASILSILFLMSLQACSKPNVKPELKVITQLEQPTPPEALTAPCKAADDPLFRLTEDILDSRQRWIVAFDECAARHNRLRNWFTGTN